MRGSWWQHYLRLRRKGVSQEVATRTFVAEVEWQRNEELRPDRLGPSQDDVPDPEPVRDPWRPVRSLGPMPKK